MSSSLLSLAIWIPILGAFVVFAAGNSKNLARWAALLVAMAGFAITIPLYVGFDVSQAGMQFVEHRAWIPVLISNTSSALMVYRCCSSS